MFRKFPILNLVFLLILILMVACTPAQPSPAATAEVPASEPVSTQSITPEPASTVAPEGQPSPTPPTQETATLTSCTEPTAIQAEGGLISYKGIQFSIDPALDLSFQAQECPEVRQAQEEGLPDLHPAYIAFTAPPNIEGNVFQPEIRIYAVGEAMQDFLYPLNSLDELKNQLAGRPEPIPWFQGAPLHTRERYLDFQNGSGARGVIELMQDLFFYTNNYLQYAYDGLTADGRYYVSVRFPLQAPFLMTIEGVDPRTNTNPQAIPVSDWPEDYEQQGKIISAYNQEALQRFEQAQDTDFTPSLAALDALVASLKVEPQSASAQGTSAPEPAAPEIPAAENWESKNLFEIILGPVTAPSGWTIYPCEGAQPALCYSTGGDNIGVLELSMIPLADHPEFQSLLTEAGLPAGPVDIRNPELAPRIRAALEAYAVDFHAAIEQDRSSSYAQDNLMFVPLGPQEIHIGDLPGVAFGFLGQFQDGRVLERNLIYLAFDGEFLYSFGTGIPQDNPQGFPSDEELQLLEPYLRETLAGLQLPIPTLPAGTQSVTALGAVEILPAYGQRSPVGQLSSDETIPVDSLGADGQYWQVACPADPHRRCWITANPALTQRAAPSEQNISVSFEQVSFTYDSTLAYAVRAEEVPAGTVEELGVVQRFPEHLVFTFVNFFADSRLLDMETLNRATGPQIFIYPTDDFHPRYNDLNPQEVIPNLKELLAKKPQTLVDPVPTLPLNFSTQVFRSQVSYLDFQNGSGVRFITQYAQEALPVTNADIFYTFQGLTRDGSAYIAAYFPLAASNLPDEQEIEDWDAFSRQYQAYLSETVQSLDNLSSTDFQPDLARLDAVIQSLVVGPR